MNMSRISDAEIDQWAKEAGSTVDTEKRRELYCKIAQKINKDIVSEQANGSLPISPLQSGPQRVAVNELYSLRLGFRGLVLREVSLPIDYSEGQGVYLPGGVEATDYVAIHLTADP